MFFVFVHIFFGSKFFKTILALKQLAPQDFQRFEVLTKYWRFENKTLWNGTPRIFMDADAVRALTAAMSVGKRSFEAMKDYAATNNFQTKITR